MSIQEINYFLEMEYVAKSNVAKMTKIYLINGTVDVFNFFKRNQRPDLWRENKWLVSTPDNPNQLFEINGYDIENLKSGTL